jgi:hypothetical protein
MKNIPPREEEASFRTGSGRMGSISGFWSVTSSDNIQNLIYFPKIHQILAATLQVANLESGKKLIQAAGLSLRLSEK